MVDIDAATFEVLVAEAIAEVPAELAAMMSNVEILIADDNPAEPGLLGLYEGIPLTERGEAYAGVLPDRITIYRLPLQAMCDTVFELADEIAVTVVHEIAHHFGIDDAQLHDWGWG